LISSRLATFLIATFFSGGAALPAPDVGSALRGGSNAFFGFVGDAAVAVAGAVVLSVGLDFAAADFTDLVGALAAGAFGGAGFGAGAAFTAALAAAGFSAGLLAAFTTGFFAAAAAGFFVGAAAGFFVGAARATGFAAGACFVFTAFAGAAADLPPAAGFGCDLATALPVVAAPLLVVTVFFTTGLAVVFAVPGFLFAAAAALPLATGFALGAAGRFADDFAGAFFLAFATVVPPVISP
jgi:hypothetical protein